MEMRKSKCMPAGPRGEWHGLSALPGDACRCASIAVGRSHDSPIRITSFPREIASAGHLEPHQAGAREAVPDGSARRLAPLFLLIITALGAGGAPRLELAGRTTRQTGTSESANTIESATLPGVLLPERRFDFAAGQTVGDSRLDVLRETYFRRHVPYGSLIYAEAVSQGLQPELVAAVVKAESSFRSSAISAGNAHGLMQLVPTTGEQMGAVDLLSPHENIRAGTRYLRYLHDRFAGDRSLALAAYNAGEGTVQRYGGVPPFRETRSYLKKVNRYQNQFQLKVDSSALRWERVRIDLVR